MNFFNFFSTYVFHMPLSQFLRGFFREYEGNFHALPQGRMKHEPVTRVSSRLAVRDHSDFEFQVHHFASLCKKIEKTNKPIPRKAGNRKMVKGNFPKKRKSVFYNEKEFSRKNHLTLLIPSFLECSSSKGGGCFPPGTKIFGSRSDTTMKLGRNVPYHESNSW